MQSMHRKRLETLVRLCSPWQTQDGEPDIEYLDEVDFDEEEDDMEDLGDEDDSEDDSEDGSEDDSEDGDGDSEDDAGEDPAPRQKRPPAPAPPPFCGNPPQRRNAAWSSFAIRAAARGR